MLAAPANRVERRHSFNGLAAFGNSADGGRRGFAREDRRRWAKPRGQGVRPGSGAGMVGTTPAQEGFGPLPQPIAARLIEEDHRQLLVQHIDRLLGRIEQFSQSGGRDAWRGHSSTPKWGKRGQAPFAGTARRVLLTKGACPPFPAMIPAPPSYDKRGAGTFFGQPPLCKAATST